MGRLQASEMFAHSDLRTALEWHLTSNLYPPMPLSMIEPCEQAIFAYYADDLQKPITLPDEVSYKGINTLAAILLIDGLHLEAFINEGEDDE